jgi:hypothetical protein
VAEEAVLDKVHKQKHAKREISATCRNNKDKRIRSVQKVADLHNFQLQKFTNI